MAVFNVSNLVAKAMGNAGVAHFDTGGAAQLRIYSGTMPTDSDTALSGNTLLAQLTFSNPSFGTATDNNPGALNTANAISDDTDADATGTASFFRIYQNNGTTCECQGDVTATGGGGTMTINSVSIVIHTTVKCTSFTLLHPES